MNPFTCPCCHASFYYDMESVDEAVLIGEATTFTNCIDLHMSRDVMPAEEVLGVFEIIRDVMEMLEAEVKLIPANV